ncbi:MAG: Coenzyme F420 hydrogenase/dehydrogenase, beta subunit C-terminal domain, partial [Promethearchaeota archaeon]
MRYQITKDDFKDLLRHLLKTNVVSEVLSGKTKRNRYSLSTEILSNPTNFDDFPLSQFIVYNCSRTDSAANALLHSKKSLTVPIAVFARACDIRALVELDKIKQVKWENLFIISKHDMGFLSEKILKKFFKSHEIDDSQIVHERLTPTKYIITMKDGTRQKFLLDDKLKIPDNCSRCIEKSHPLADFLLGTYALPEDSQDYVITPQSDRAHALIDALGWTGKAISDELNAAYEAEADKIVETAQKKREKEIGEFLANENRFDLFTTCTACGNCVRSCPVCFCVECSLLAGVKAKTIDKMTFLTSRFSHISDTCVECGRCALNCPMNIPLDLYF